MGAWRYDPCRTPGRGPTPKARALLELLKELDPDGHSLGIFANRPVRGGSALSVHACGRALDWHPGEAETGMHRNGDRLNHILIHEHASEFDIQLVIWNRQQWGGRRGPFTAPYHGVNPHTDHLHIEVRR